MAKKLKKTVSILLSLIMVFSLFTIVPISAGATTYDSGYVDARNLQVGDIITGSVEGAYFYDYTVVLKGGGYASGIAYIGMIDEIYSEDRSIPGDCFDLEIDDGHLMFDDYNDYGEFVPVANNKIVDASLFWRRTETQSPSAVLTPTQPSPSYGRTGTVRRSRPTPM